MSVVIWARVSSREQKDGYSLDAQLRVTRDRAGREGLKVAREFTVAESAKRGAERDQFNAMVAWVKKNARREGITHILAHKLDRVCRNMRDAVRMQELEDQCGVKLMFVDNQFGPGAAGALSFNVMAAVAQYYSDNLRTEVLKGMNEKARQGWLPGLSPYGYRNVTGNKEEPIQVDPDDGPTVQRIFELYARGDTTFKRLAATLHAEGRRHSASQPRFAHTTLSYILNNRFYIGELEWQGQHHPGRHKPLVERFIFERCQDILNGRNRRTGTPTIPYGGGLFRCGICGKAMIGEEIKRKLKDGGCNRHYYYKCHGACRNGHPNVRWKQENMEAEVAMDLERMKMGEEEAAWFREALEAGFRDEEATRREQRGRWTKRQGEVKGMLERLLNGFLGGAIDEATFKAKSTALKTEEAELAERLADGRGGDAGAGKWALAAFDFSQRAAELWRGSTFEARREILDCLWSNRVLTDVTISLIRRKPFDVLVEGPFLKNGGRYWT